MFSDEDYWDNHLEHSTHLNVKKFFDKNFKIKFNSINSFKLKSSELLINTFDPLKVKQIPGKFYRNFCAIFGGPGETFHSLKFYRFRNFVLFSNESFQ